MDKIEEASNLIKALNDYRNQKLEDFELIKITCSFFDKIKDEDLVEADLNFLKYISNIIGIPHFFDLLGKFQENTSLNSFDLNTLSAVIYESTLNLSTTIKVHKYQKQILKLFKPGQLNRYFLSASTSFGKTHIVFEIIRKMDYDNVVLIFPTIALLSENLERLTSDSNYNYFVQKYSIHTLSEVESIDDKNLFIYTPERYLSFIEKREEEIDFDFAFVDEVYKIDNEYIIDEEVRENERDVAYRLAIFYSLKKDVDTLLAGPYIDFSRPDDKDYNKSFDDFLEKNTIRLINYNNYEIVNKTYSDVKGKKEYKVDYDFDLKFQKSSKNDRLVEILSQIFKIDENTIIYCYSRSSVESYARSIIASGVLEDYSFDDYIEFVDHISDNFNSEWILISALKHGIGIHHGLVPKYIQKEIVSLFNIGHLKILLSTTTITEGVNTSAKNLIVLHNKKGNKPLKKFDAKNIAGRAGRFLHHYNGRVIVLKNKFMDAINSEPEGIKHKNYDLQSPKEEVDLFYTRQEYLTDSDKTKIIDINQLQAERNIPDEVFNLYKVVSRRDKISIYDKIIQLNDSDIESIKRLIRSINFRMDIDYDGFQITLNILEPIVKNQKLKFLIEYKGENNEYSTLTHLVHFYLTGGFGSSVDYKLNKGLTVDKAISETSEFVYNILKYQVVKYLGVFNIMYKFYMSQKTAQPMDEVIGLDKLLTKLEYNAFTEKGRIASDFGVPNSIIDFYENEEKSEIKNEFDNYELRIFNKVETIINNEDRNSSN
ncbi:helicase-related protein [Aureisphaera galaxeae]|uniref:helicase-related protein n=1 Tax=Aureisphaera galaxeae TaxID=1538023 RepID=UPI00235057AF|nr:helicase-related protein [Aureisphaera galaxeae]MDC8002921.1 helicase-related protein [Aureisphaera galaxeae]